MKSYKIPVIWSVTATMEIEAESLEDAILKAEGGRLSTTPDYLDGSFEVDMALLESYGHTGGFCNVDKYAYPLDAG